MSAETSLLEPDEGPSFELVNPAGRSSAVLLCDHASHRIPRALGTLGLSDEHRIEHIAWDPGAALLARRMSELLDAPLVLSGWSRLVIDCNRPPSAESSIPATTGGVVVPGNANVSASEREARARECFWPYHRAISALLDERKDRLTRVLTVHSFTPVLLGQVRPWQLAMLYGRDRSLASFFLEALREEPSLTVGDNEPYRVTDEGDYSIPVYAERRGLQGVLLEVRNDQLRTDGGIEEKARLLCGIYARLGA